MLDEGKAYKRPKKGVSCNCTLQNEPRQGQFDKLSRPQTYKLTQNVTSFNEAELPHSIFWIAMHLGKTYNGTSNQHNYIKSKPSNGRRISKQDVAACFML